MSRWLLAAIVVLLLAVPLGVEHLYSTYYLQLLTWVLLQAEDTLHDQVDDTEKLHIEGKAAFARLASLKRELGKTNVATLRALLPFSRNDYWEISELEERLGS